MQESRKSRLTHPLVVALIAAFACFLWGSATPVIKIGNEMFSIESGDTWKLILFAGMRFSLAGLMVILFDSLIRRKPSLPNPRSWGRIALHGLFQTVLQYTFFYIGVAHCSGVHAAIFSGMSSLLAILMACFLFRQEKPHPGKLVGCVVGFCGILAMNLNGEGGGFSLQGEGAMLVAGLSAAVASCLARIYSRTERSVVLTGWQFLLGGLCLCGFGLLGGGRISFPSAASVLLLMYLSFVSAVAYSLWTLLISRTSVSMVSIYGFLTPLFGVLLSAIILREADQAFSLNSLSALALVCVGIVCVNRLGNRPGSTKVHE